jgi:microcystin-dependent protein
MNITISFPPLPAGYSQSPDSFLQWIAENATFEADGDALSGQIGGDRPTDNVGIWFGDDAVEKYRDGDYQTITDVPIGSIVFDCRAGGDAPPNFLYAEGQSLTREDYPLLFAAIGVTWGSESATTFNVPDFRGRVPIGADGISNAGPGTYEEQGVTARMDSHAVGTYYGFGHPRNTTPWEAAPTGAQGARRFTGSGIVAATTNNIGVCEPPSAAVRAIIRYR